MIQDFFTELLCPEWTGQARERLSRVGSTSIDVEPTENPDNNLSSEFLNAARTSHEHDITKAATMYWRNVQDLAEAFELNSGHELADTFINAISLRVAQSVKERAYRRFISNFLTGRCEDSQSDLPASDMAWFTASEEDSAARLSLAQHPDCPIAVLELLACDIDAKIARAAARNLNAQLAMDEGIATGNLAGSEVQAAVSERFASREAV